MRLFWAILLLLLLAGAAASFLYSPSTPAAPQPARISEAPPAPVALPEPTPTEPEPTPTVPTTPTTPPAPGEAAPVDFNADLNRAISEAVKADPAAKAAIAAAEGTPVELPTTATWPPAKMTPAKAVRIADELVIDGRYRVKGAGTEKDPYIVPFELLMSAADIYDPRKGLTKMPQRVAFLHEKYVKLNGYIAFPISSTDPRQMLVMFNQWDGCCIGVPPSTYDSIETNLDQPATGDDKFITFGTTTGILKVDPYIDNGWLLGLYVLDHGTLSDGKSDPVSPKQVPEN
jgi:hypothetical protein